MHIKFLSWLTLLGLLTANISAVAQGTAGTTAPTTATETRLGTIRASRVIGDVTVENVATKVRAPLVNNQEITQGNIVRTGENSSVVLIFSNGATVNLAFSTELNIEEFIQNPFEGVYEPAKATDEPSFSSTNIRLTRGELVGNVKKLKTNLGSKFTVGTPVGAAGIRGTTFRIVYRPTGNGQAFNFVLTTVEGNVELATGTVTMPVSVTDNTEVVINEVVVNPTTNEITMTTTAGETVTLTAPPPASDAPVSTVQAVTGVAQSLADAIVNVVIAPPTTLAPPSSTPPGGGGGAGGDGDSNANTPNNTDGNQGNNPPNSEPNPNSPNTGPNSNNPPPNTAPSSNLPGSPGNTTQPPRVTPGAGN